MSEPVTFNVRLRNIYFSVVGGRLAEAGVYRVEEYSNGLVRELPPTALPIEQLGSILHNDDLPLILQLVVAEMVARNIPLPELP